MNDNPYQPPATEDQVAGVLSGSLDDLRAVAKYQKGIIICILLYLVTLFGQFAVPEGFRGYVYWAAILVSVAGTAYVFLLCTKVYRPGVGVLIGLLALVPVIGVVVLLSVNGKATKILRQNGIRVGLLGADLSQVRLERSTSEQADY
jgi:hypothetical protein